WGWPVVLALMTAVGMLSALLGDGAWDAASWVALGIPTGVCVWFGWRGRGASTKASKKSV
ncbi:MAG: hypothetical protein ABUL50_02865, partial [Rhizobacter sp.]